MKEILRTEQLVKNYPKKKQEGGSDEIKVLKQIDLSINCRNYGAFRMRQDNLVKNTRIHRAADKWDGVF